MKTRDEPIIQQVASNCADKLGVVCPKINFSKNKKTEGNLATLVLNENRNPEEIIVSENYVVIYDVLFDVCHELRHVWQTYNQPEMFNSYVEIGNIDLEEYNLQPAEIDANAFAAVCMEEWFGVKPMFEGYSDVVKKKIWGRVREIGER
nr:MAG TPA: IrrE N-terminal-like domain [Caudoviricetes sp.]